MSNVIHFGAKGDGVTDDTEAIRHAVSNHDGVLHFPRGTYLIGDTIEIPLDKTSPICIDGTGGTATLRMSGAGPALRLSGNHTGTGDPGSVVESVWQRERMPVIQHLVIEGSHPEADGIQLLQTMQAFLEGVNVRHVRNGIHLHQRNRNVLISHCHVYHNTGVGIFLDQVNLHQINIASSHISYNRRGGIRIERSEVRNLQITGNDIEYNNAKSHKELPREPTAEIWIDTTAEKASVNEVTICSNTIQATESAGGCNIRIIETPETGRPPGLWAITGNIIGSQENNVHLTGCYGVTLTGNCIYSCGHRNVLIENSSQINLSGNSFRRHTPQYHTGVRVVNSRDCLITGCALHDETDGGQKTGASLLELEACERITVTGCQFTNGVPYGIDAKDSSNVLISGCTAGDHRKEKRAQGAVRFSGQGQGNQVVASQMLGEISGLISDP